MNVLRPLHNYFIRHSVQAKRDTESRKIQALRKVMDPPVPGETGFAFHGAGKPGDDGCIGLQCLPQTRPGVCRDGKMPSFMHCPKDLGFAKVKIKGFTLLEVMVALSIVAGVLVPLLVSQSEGISMQDETKFRTTAALLAQKKISEIEVKGKDDLIADYGDFGDDFPDYFWEINIQDFSFPEIDEEAQEYTKYLKQIDLNVYRGEKKRYQYALRLYRFFPK
jgi:general secretion pathway protein I